MSLVPYIVLLTMVKRIKSYINYIKKTRGVSKAIQNNIDSQAKRLRNNLLFREIKKPHDYKSNSIMTDLMFKGKQWVFSALV